ncbi:MAG TPA: polyribonucleotide nucleotidyltransferase, partial [Bacillota bacterium]|nr:polyribonucleotide nucleotidyltransferase [Bacillota bacterium]
MHQSFQMNVGGRVLTVETGKLAKQASGSAFMRYGDTAVLVTAVCSAKPREGIDFFPLTVDFEERMYAAGKIPGGFIKREGRPTEKATLSGRLIDRPLRPLFPEGFRNDVQVVNTVMSVDQDHDASVTAMIGASVALSISDIPFNGPIAGVIVGRIDGEFIINPTREQAEASDMHLTVAGTKDAVMMVEAGCKEVPESVILEGIMFGHDVIKEIVAFIEKIAAEIGQPKREINLAKVDEGINAAVRGYVTQPMSEAVRIVDKLERQEAIDKVKESTREHFADVYPEDIKSVDTVVGKVLKEIVRTMILEEGIRPDGRAIAEIRPITCEVGLLPRAHGSGLFTRGQTQAMTVTTLGPVSDEQMLDGLGAETSKRYIHHYNFPPYSVGESRPMRGPSRRDIGHGALAERALEPMIPAEADFPYTIRLVSEILESNGSSSMASVCGSTMSLMDAGVPIKRPVAGVAMGLVKTGEKVTVLTDIQGMEDALGDMDFKVAGTEKGVTAIQMDIKIAGIDRPILESALKQAYEGRMFILGKMLEAISTPRTTLSPYAPRVIHMTIDPDKIRVVIGPGGKTIKKIIEDTGVDIDIEDDGRVFIYSSEGEGGDKAKAII